MEIKNKKTEDKYKKFQDRLPFWNDNLFEQANVLARSNIFTISELKKSEYVDNFTKQFCLGGNDSISYRGLKLNTFDEEVLKQLLFYRKGQSLTYNFELSKKRILEDLKKPNNGHYCEKIDISISRLLSGEFLVSSKAALAKLYYLIEQSMENEKQNKTFAALLAKEFGDYMEQIGEALNENKGYAISLRILQRAQILDDASPRNRVYNLKFDPLMVLLFDGIETTRTSRMINSMLTKPATKRLYQFFLSHGGLPHNMTLGIVPK